MPLLAFQLPTPSSLICAFGQHQQVAALGPLRNTWQRQHGPGVHRAGGYPRPGCLQAGFRARVPEDARLLGPRAWHDLQLRLRTALGAPPSSRDRLHKQTHVREEAGVSAGRTLTDAGRQVAVMLPVTRTRSPLMQLCARRNCQEQNNKFILILFSCHICVCVRARAQCMYMCVVMYAGKRDSAHLVVNRRCVRSRQVRDKVHTSCCRLADTA